MQAALHQEMQAVKALSTSYKALGKHSLSQLVTMHYQLLPAELCVYTHFDCIASAALQCMTEPDSTDNYCSGETLCRCEQNSRLASRILVFQGLHAWALFPTACCFSYSARSTRSRSFAMVGGLGLRTLTCPGMRGFSDQRPDLHLLRLGNKLQLHVS